MKAKHSQILKIVKDVIPVEEVTITYQHGLPCGEQIIVHGWTSHNIVMSVFDWDDTGDNRQRISDSYNEYLASQ